MQSSTPQSQILPSLEAIRQARARKRLVRFACYVDRAYRPGWHHEALAGVLDQVLAGEIKRLMVFMPPQHGKSTLVSQHFPAFAFGHNPDLKIVAASYAADLAQKNNRSIQRIMETNEYRALFPDSALNARNIRALAGSALRNTDEFEIVGRLGAYKGAGVNGQLTGFSAGLGIIDDPYKDYAEAMSETIRQAVWEWYSSVFLSRTHDNSPLIVTLTRWHKLDIAGQLLALQGRVEDGGAWHVLELPALFQGQPDPSDPKDKRRYNPHDRRTLINEALWPERVSTETLIERRTLNAYQFAAMYQQDPQAKTGQKFSRKAIKQTVASLADVPTGLDLIRKWDMAATEGDGAWTVGLLIGRDRKSGKYYILDYVAVQYGTTKRDQFIRSTAEKDHEQFGLKVLQLGPQDPGAAGVDAALAFKENLTGFRVETHIETGDKELRAEPVESAWGAGMIIVLEGPWNDQLYDRLEQFPHAGKDEADSLSGGFNELFKRAARERRKQEESAQSYSWSQV